MYMLVVPYFTLPLRVSLRIRRQILIRYCLVAMAPKILQLTT